MIFEFVLITRLQVTLSLL